LDHPCMVGFEGVRGSGGREPSSELALLSAGPFAKAADEIVALLRGFQPL